MALIYLKGTLRYQIIMLCTYDFEGNFLQNRYKMIFKVDEKQNFSVFQTHLLSKTVNDEIRPVQFSEKYKCLVLS